MVLCVVSWKQSFRVTKGDIYLRFVSSRRQYQQFSTDKDKKNVLGRGTDTANNGKRNSVRINGPYGKRTRDIDSG